MTRAVFLLLTFGAVARGDITGRVTVTGTPAEPDTVIRTTADPKCALHGNQVRTENWKIGPGNGLAEAVVWVEGAPAGAKPGKATLLQKNCRYEPHVTALEKGGTVAFTNGDPTIHNVHGIEYHGKGEGGKDLFNIGEPYQGTTVEHVFGEAGVYLMKCDVHPWMLGWIVVTDSGFFAVTGADGSFQIPGALPDGAYMARAWHGEFSKTLEQNFTVKEGRAVLEFAFDAAKADGI